MEENEFVIKKEGSILQVYLGFAVSIANSTTLPGNAKRISGTGHQ